MVLLFYSWNQFEYAEKSDSMCQMLFSERHRKWYVKFIKR